MILVFGEDLRELGTRPLIKYRINKPYDHAHNAHIDDDLYGQRSRAETVFSSVKRSPNGATETRSDRRAARRWRQAVLVPTPI